MFVVLQVPEGPEQTQSCFALSVNMTKWSDKRVPLAQRDDIDVSEGISWEVRPLEGLGC
jgi:hypothetical protein